MEHFNIEDVLKNHCEFVRFINLLQEINREGGIAAYIELVKSKIADSGDMRFKSVWRDNLKWLEDNRYALVDDKSVDSNKEDVKGEW